MKKRKEQLRKAVLSMTAAAMMLGSSLSVSAAGLGDVFDAEYYADTYADVKAAFGDDADALFQHYLTYGISEGRAGRADFNVSQYRSAYADLDAAFGDDWDAYAEHYLTYGIAEGRTGVTSPAGVPIPERRDRRRRRRSRRRPERRRRPGRERFLRLSAITLSESFGVFGSLQSMIASGGVSLTRIQKFICLYPAMR